jgi:acylphosphatase
VSAQTAAKAVRVRIHGRVQGVCYRAWTVERARQLELAGWVRNRVDGSVEALFAGPGERVERMLDDCRRGPPAARVERLEVGPEPYPDDTAFVMLATG